ncbi:hypothetical protein FSP39_016798 [Pinctada imbricata]|uniref:Ubiquitin-like protease family profile domain-containing protein n=1 Tax=Pinctada imbricata TaxID=66713 RepID=A0AA88XZE6_PINIB|nr:hypothetical protein FSP39_016798 [Pinctada imbricata]
MQPTTYAPVWCDKEHRWKNQIPFSAVVPPAAQIHHTGKHHWVASTNNYGQINILDSKSNGKLTPSLEIQLTSLYGNGDANKLFPIKIPSIQQQGNNHDCGFYAIANLTQYCYGGYVGKEEIKYNESYMRDHLVYCLERQMFTPFPRIQTKTKINKKKPKTVTIDCHCNCGQPNCLEEMVGCDGMDGTCTVWRHRSCAAPEDIDGDWFCTPHRV